MGKEIVTKIGIVKQETKRTIGVSYGSDIVDTTLGKVRLSYETKRAESGGVNNVVHLDCTDAPELLWRSSKKPTRKISVNSAGIGSQQVRNFEIIVETTVFQTQEQ